MVSFQRLAPAPTGSFVKTTTLKQYAAVAINYTDIQFNTPGYQGRNSHKVYGTFTFFDSEGKNVGEVGPNAQWEVSVGQTGRSIIDRFPSAPGAVLVTLTERQGTGVYVGKAFNEISDPDPELEAKIIATLEASPAVDEADAPPPF